MKNIDDYTIEELKEIIQQREQNWKEQAKGRYFIYSDSIGRFKQDSLGIDEQWLYKEKAGAKLFAKKVDLFNRMNLFALIHNDGWVADWNDENQNKWGIEHYDNCFIRSNNYIYNDFLFGISVKSKEIAEAMLEEFKDELEIYLK